MDLELDCFGSFWIGGEGGGLGAEGSELAERGKGDGPLSVDGDSVTGAGEGNEDVGE